MIHDQPFFLEDPSNRERSFENQVLLKLRVSNHLSVDPRKPDCHYIQYLKSRWLTFPMVDFPEPLLTYQNLVSVLCHLSATRGIPRHPGETPEKKKKVMVTSSPQPLTNDLESPQFCTALNHPLTGKESWWKQTEKWVHINWNVMKRVYSYIFIYIR